MEQIFLDTHRRHSFVSWIIRIIQEELIRPSWIIAVLDESDLRPPSLQAEPCRRQDEQQQDVDQQVSVAPLQNRSKAEREERYMCA